MIHSTFKTIPCLAGLTLGTLLFTACGDDDSFSPVSKDRGYEYAYTSAKDLSKTPCDSMRMGREAVIGRDKDLYECIFDEQDSVYLWAGENDTLTANGKTFVRKDESSSSQGSSSSEDDEDSSSSRASSSSEEDDDSSSSSRSSSSYSSSSNRSSSSSYSSSSSSSNSSSSRDLQTAKDSHFNPDITYGTMKDSRDGKTYRTVVVDGVTWMAENLNYEDHTIGKSNCYDDSDDNCELYGRMYSRDATMNDSRCEYGSSCDLGEGPIQGVCPDGWHIPTKKEVQNLLDYATAPALRSASAAWSNPGVDSYGLSFVGAGNWDSDDGYEDMQSYEVMWLYTPSSYQYFLLVSSSAEVWDHSSSEYYGTVRCIKDEAAPGSSSSSVSSSSSRPKLTNAEPLLEAGTQFNSEITYGTMTDSRDSKTYKTVVIGGKTWMAENLNYAGNAIGESFCFNDEDRFCDVYGRLYSRDAAMNDAGCNKNSCDLGDAPIQGVCPSGWHIPSKAEIDDLVNSVSENGLTLMSTEGWDESMPAGTNPLDLSLVGSGDYDSSKHFEHLGVDAFLWLYSEGSQTYVVVRGEDSNIFVNTYTSSQLYNSVRCVKN
jgi:uncharacterized protein (TIGR02145 family)